MRTHDLHIRIRAEPISIRLTFGRCQCKRKQACKPLTVWLINVRNEIFFKGYFESGPTFLGYLGFTAWNATLVALGSAMTLWVAPGAAGCGV